MVLFRILNINFLTLVLMRVNCYSSFVCIGVNNMQFSICDVVFNKIFAKMIFANISFDDC